MLRDDIIKKVIKNEKVNVLKKSLLTPKWGIFTLDWAQNLVCIVFKIQCKDFLKFCMMIGHYKLTKVTIINILKNSYCPQNRPFQYSLIPQPCIVVRIHLCHTQSFLGIPVHISNAYLSGTEEPPPWLRSLPKNVLEFKITR